MSENRKSIEELLKEIENKLAYNETLQLQDIENLKTIYERLNILWNRFLRVFSVVEHTGQIDDEIKQEFQNIKNELQPELVSILAEKLRKQGYSIGKKKTRSENKTFAESLETVLFRLIELTRLGKRTEVYHILLRSFAASKVGKFPRELAQAFKPHYSTEDFKVLLFSFLTGIQEALIEEGSKAETSETQ